MVLVVMLNHDSALFLHVVRIFRLHYVVWMQDPQGHEQMLWDAAELAQHQGFDWDAYYSRPDAFDKSYLQSDNRSATNAPMHDVRTLFRVWEGVSDSACVCCVVADEIRLIGVLIF